MGSELKNCQTQVETIAAGLQKSEAASPISAEKARNDQMMGPGRLSKQPRLADILAKAQKSLAGIDREEYWAERELTDSRASWRNQG